MLWPRRKSQMLGTDEILDAGMGGGSRFGVTEIACESLHNARFGMHFAPFSPKEELRTPRWIRF